MGLADFSRKIASDWDALAKKNARHFIATGKAKWDDEEFFSSGWETVRNLILSDLGNVCQGTSPTEMTVLEIGCGSGRVTHALARLFGQVVAVDVSAEMIRLAKKALRNVQNVQLLQNNGYDLSLLNGVTVDFAFSCIVFQHIPSLAIIENYFQAVSLVLRTGGLFQVQVQGTRCTRDEADTWVGVAVTRAEAERMAERHSFELRYMEGEGTQECWLWLFRK